MQEEFNKLESRKIGMEEAIMSLLTNNSLEKLGGREDMEQRGFSHCC